MGCGLQTHAKDCAENGKAKRKPYKELRSMEYLTPDEVDRLMTAAKDTGRYGHRDKTLILIAYRHALRVSAGLPTLGHG